MFVVMEVSLCRDYFYCIGDFYSSCLDDRVLEV